MRHVDCKPSLKRGVVDVMLIRILVHTGQLGLLSALAADELCSSLWSFVDMESPQTQISTDKHRKAAA